MLDAVAQNTEIREDYVACYTKYKKARTELERLRNEISKKKEDEDYLRYSLRQFEAANLKENEEEELEAEQQRLSHAEEITEALAETCRTMDSEEGSVIDSLSRCAENISRISKFLPDAGSLSKRIDSVCIELRDIYGDLCGHSEDNDYNPERLQQVDERLSVIYDLERKYHTDSYVQLLKKEDELRSQLEIIDDGSEILEEKEKLCEKLQKAMLEKAATLTAARKEAAGTFARQMTARLVPLGMPDVKFKVETTPLPNADITGADDVKYLFSANKSSALRDIGDIASGGEISRVMLCIKAIVSEVKGLPTIVFDEIDTGVSGRIAEQMAKSMQCICKGGTQVICITHLPQIAARGDFHYLVYKSNDDDITSSRMEQLSEGMRLNEIAKMLSGSEITEAAISNAKELLNRKDKQ